MTSPPSLLSARIDLGSLLMQQQRLEEAEQQFRSILRDEPHRAGVQLFLVECLLGQRKLEAARVVLAELHSPGMLVGRYVGLRPHEAELWARLGSALLDAIRFEEAEAACQTALQTDPTNFRARANLGSIAMAQSSLEEAEQQFRRLISEHPQEERARLLLITCLARTGETAATCREIEAVVQLAPTSFLVHKCVMGPYYSLGCWDEYRAEIERFRRVEPTSAYLDYELSFVELLFGDMRQGWEHYEARLQVPQDLRPGRYFAQPAWAGEPFEGKTLLVWTEQGFGDTFMFLRYLPLVKARGGLVLLETQAPTLLVAGTCRGVDQLISQGDPHPPFDLQVSIMSLARIFQTELSSITDPVPYVRVPTQVTHRSELKERLDSAGDRTRIGLAWAGNPAHARDHERSVPVAALAPLAGLSDVAWFSFQVGHTEFPPLPGIVTLAPWLGDFADTAYALHRMDLLITVDTSVAHLAGAMGVPTLLLLTHQPDYRWLLGREDSPWYPTLRLYRQPRYGDWGAVLQRIVTDLSQGV